MNMQVYRIVLYLCAAAVAAIVAYRLVRATRRPGVSLARARVVNEIIWTAIPVAVLAWLLVRR